MPTSPYIPRISSCTTRPRQNIAVPAKHFQTWHCSSMWLELQRQGSTTRRPPWEECHCPHKTGWHGLEIPSHQRPTKDGRPRKHWSTINNSKSGFFIEENHALFLVQLNYTDSVDPSCFNYFQLFFDYPFQRRLPISCQLKRCTCFPSTGLLEEFGPSIPSPSRTRSHRYCLKADLPPVPVQAKAKTDLHPGQTWEGFAWSEIHKPGVELAKSDPKHSSGYVQLPTTLPIPAANLKALQLPVSQVPTGQGSSKANNMQSTSCDLSTPYEAGEGLLSYILNVYVCASAWWRAEQDRGLHGMAHKTEEQAFHWFFHASKADLKLLVRT